MPYCNVCDKNVLSRVYDMHRQEHIEEFKKKEYNVKFKQDALIYFTEEKKPYKIRAFDNRFAVCTKPYNPKHTVLYTIVDFEKNIRGTEDLIFCEGFETDEDCKLAIHRLSNWETEVSKRTKIPLNIKQII